ncbi:hypothetical protein C8J56DRAFT_884494 [Mycena floridula]|nr:hypothetical protein C8J56DRAFT_884494 [Mycena floridula]
MYDPYEYMPCPGTQFDGLEMVACKAIIPRKIVCTGANKGKSCQRCNDCGYFTWLPGASPANFPNSSPRPDYQNGLFDQPPFTQFPSQSPGQSTLEFLVNGPSQARNNRCKQPGCMRTVKAQACSTHQCSVCCKASSIQCQYKKHNLNNARAVIVSTAPHKLSRPLPSIPLSQPSALTFTFPSESPSSMSDPFIFKKPLPEEWLEDRNTNLSAREARAQAAEARAQNEKEINHRVNLWFYAADKQESSLFPIHVSTWPTVRISRLAGIDQKLSLFSLVGIQVYDPTLRAWHSELDTPIRVTTRQHIVLRAPGVTECPGLEALFSKSSSSTKPSRKRAHSPDIEVSQPYKNARHAPPLSPASSRSSSPIAVTAKSNNRKTAWPQGFYARDMARGFDKIERSAIPAEASFQVAFPGIKFVRATWFLHKRNWRELTDNQREWARRSPTDDDGYLWSAWLKNPKV